MISKKNHPKIDLRDWISVEGTDCLVTQVYTGYSMSGACEVVTNPDRPTNMDVGWDGEKWVFSPDPPLVNAAKTSRLEKFVATLQEKKNGNWGQ